MKTIREHAVITYEKGIVNTIEDTLIDDGAASASSNFLTLPDRIELIKGRRLIGSEETGNNKVLGLGRITKVDGTELVLRKIGTILQYYNSSTEVWLNIKTGLLANEPLYFSNSFTPAGRQIWMCGQDGLFKLYPSAPTDIIDLTNATKNYKGQISIDKSRMICWGMKEDPTGLRFSRVDKDANYTLVASEAVSSATEKHYTGTLAKTQVFGLVFTKGIQVLRDDKNGNLTGDGTGTINYATGAYVLDFTTSNATAVTVSYLWEDPLDEGLADFTYSATRLAGEGNVLRQDSIGTKSQIVVNYNDTYYTLQDRGSWTVKIATTDLTFDNQIYRLNIGCPSHNGAVVTSEGIIFVDTYNHDEPKLRRLEFNLVGDKIIPTDLSLNFKMEEYIFDEDTALFKKGTRVFIACKQDSENNNKIIIYDIVQKSFDVVDYTTQLFEELNDQIIVGDSVSPNVYELFTGKDDLDYEVLASWEGKKHNMKTDYLKKYKRFRQTGYIDLDQSYDIFHSYDNEPYVRIGTISGDQSYVDFDSPSLIGKDVLGDQVIGLSDASKAGYFETEIKVKTPKFKRLKVKYVPLGIGYLAIMEQRFADIRIKSSKIPRKYKIGVNEGIGFESISDAFEVS